MNAYRLIFVVFTILFLAPVVVGATTYIIQPDGNGDLPTIQAAVNVCTDGDLVELTGGIFTGVGNRDIDYLGKAITIISQSGNPETCIIDCQGSAADPHRAFIFQTGEDNDSELRGVKVIGGYLSGYDMGGAILCDECAAPTIENCIFTGNHAPQGGGLACHDTYPVEYCVPLIINCRFIDNSADGGGGISCIGWDVRPEITGCTFRENSASSGGGMNWDVAGPALTNCVFIENEASYSGGAISAIDVFDFPSLYSCIFDGNSASYGGALAINEGSPTITGCLFSGNSGTNNGGAIYANDWVFDNTISGCTFSGNSSGDAGGGIWISGGSTLNIESSIIAFSNDGEAIACATGGIATATCCDIFDNADGDWVGCIQGQESLPGNMSQDPQFCDADTGDYRLHLLSPCLPENNDCGELIGAFGIGCGFTATEAVSWSVIKAIY